MKRSELIGELAKNVKPVKSVSYGFKHLFALVFLFVSLLALMLYFVGKETVINDKLNSKIFILESISLFLAGIFFVMSSLWMSIPGKSFKIFSRISLALIGVWLAILVYTLIHADIIEFEIGLACVKDIVLLSIIPVVLIIALIAKAAPLDRRQASFHALAAGASFAALGTQFVCTHEDGAHLILWHFLPVVIISLAGLVIGKMILKKI